MIEEQVQQLLSEEFGIVSEMPSRDRRGNGRHEKIEYVLEAKNHDYATRYVREVGSYKQSHQEKIREALGDR